MELELMEDTDVNFSKNIMRTFTEIKLERKKLLEPIKILFSLKM